MSTEAKKPEATKEKTETTKEAPRTQKFVEANIYRLSSKVLFRQAVFFSKIIMKKHGNVQIEAIGAATSEATKVAQTLVKHGYAKLKSIRTEQFIGERGERDRFQIKIIINL